MSDLIPEQPATGHTQDDLKWNMNTANIVSKANARMELLRKVASFGTSTEELRNVHKKPARAVSRSVAQLSYC